MESDEEDQRDDVGIDAYVGYDEEASIAGDAQQLMELDGTQGFLGSDRSCMLMLE